MKKNCEKWKKNCEKSVREVSFRQLVFGKCLLRFVRLGKKYIWEMSFRGNAFDVIIVNSLSVLHALVCVKEIISLHPGVLLLNWDFQNFANLSVVHNWRSGNRKKRNMSEIQIHMTADLEFRSFQTIETTNQRVGLYRLFVVLNVGRNLYKWWRCNRASSPLPTIGSAFHSVKVDLPFCIDVCACAYVRKWDSAVFFFFFLFAEKG